MAAKAAGRGDPQQIKAVLYDIDDTLVDFGGAALAGLLDLWGPLGETPQAEVARIWHAESERQYSRFTSGELGFVQMQHARLADFLHRAGRAVPGDAGLAALELRRQAVMTAAYRLFGDVPSALAAAGQAGLAVGVLSNSDGPHQRAKLAAVGLAETFPVVVISGEVGVAKPDPEIFRIGCAALGLPAAEVMYVGDRPDTDAAAATAAGMAGVWLNRTGLAAVPGLPTVTSLEQLPALGLWPSAGP